MANEHDIGELCMSSTLERDALQMSDRLNSLGHTIVIGPTSTGMSFPPENVSPSGFLSVKMQTISLSQPA